MKHIVLVKLYWIKFGGYFFVNFYFFQWRYESLLFCSQVCFRSLGQLQVVGWFKAGGTFVKCYICYTYKECYMYNMSVSRNIIIHFRSALVDKEWNENLALLIDECFISYVLYLPVSCNLLCWILKYMRWIPIGRSHKAIGNEIYRLDQLISVCIAI